MTASLKPLVTLISAGQKLGFPFSSWLEGVRDVPKEDPTTGDVKWAAFCLLWIGQLGMLPFLCSPLLDNNAVKCSLSNQASSSCM